jgi:hypothetical protein
MWRLLINKPPHFNITKAMSLNMDTVMDTITMVTATGIPKK